MNQSRIFSNQKTTKTSKTKIQIFKPKANPSSHLLLTRSHNIIIIITGIATATTTNNNINKMTRRTTPVSLSSLLLCLLICSTLAFPSLQVQRLPNGDENAASSSSSSSSSEQQQQQKQRRSARGKLVNPLASSKTTQSNNNFDETLPVDQAVTGKKEPVMDVLNDFSTADGTSSTTTTTTTGTTLKQSPTQQQRLRKNKNILIVSLMTLTGITEAICFRTFKCFPNMMTGNTVRCMEALAEFNVQEMIFYGTLLTSYVVGSGIPRAMEVWKSNNSNNKTTTAPTTLLTVGRMAFVLLGISDLFKGKSLLARMPWMAVAFGMINAATLKESGAVTNAITGHWGKIGGGAAEVLFLSGKERKPNAGFITSLRCAGVFMFSLVITTMIAMWVETTQPAILLRLPPLGATLGVLYMALFGWYCNNNNTNVQQKEMGSC